MTRSGKVQKFKLAEMAEKEFQKKGMKASSMHTARVAANKKKAAAQELSK
jgi:hypothetical protein